MPRTKIQLKSKDYDKIEKLASRGVAETKICDALGICFNTWQRIKKEDEQAATALEKARCTAEAELRNMLYDLAMKENDRTAAIFLLKAQFGWKEGEALVNGNAVQVNITLPGSMNPEDYLKEVNNE